MVAFEGPTFEAKRGGGRPSALTPEAREAFLTVLRTGAPVRDAARTVGLKPGTVEHWILRGRGKLRDRAPRPEYVSFAEEVEAAGSYLNAEIMQVLSRVLLTGKHPDLLLKWAQSRMPETFGSLRPERPIDDEDELLRIPAIAQPPPELPAGDSEDQPVTFRETIRTVTVPKDRFGDFARLIRGSDRTHAESAERLAQFRDDDVPRP